MAAMVYIESVVKNKPQSNGDTAMETIMTVAALTIALNLIIKFTMAVIENATEERR